MAYKKLEYKNYKVRTAVKSFRDLEVYQKTISLSSEIFNVCEKIRRSKKALSQRLLEEFETLYKFSKNVPRLIAESYGDRFSDFTKGIVKMEETMRIVSNIVTKIDCLVLLVDSEEITESLNKAREKYQKQRVKINNLKRAWEKARESFSDKKE